MTVRTILTAALLVAASAATASPARMGRFYDWSAARRTSLVLTAGGVTATVTARRDGDRAAPVVRVTARGRAAVTIVGESGSPTFVAKIGLGRLRARDALPAVVVESYSGGAHCCNHVEVVVAVAGRLRAVDLGSWNGGPDEDFPTDLTGDGVVDFRFGDDAFLYAFSSYAGSFAPAKVLSVIDGRVRDVSRAPGLRAMREAELAAARGGCVATDGGEVNGACAGYAGVAALLGRFDAVWPRIAAHYDRKATWFPTRCRVAPAPSGCPPDATIAYSDFPTALRAFLVGLKYLPADPAPRQRSFALSETPTIRGSLRTAAM